MIRLRLGLTAVLISFSVVQYAQSAITNGRFETGDFSGWTLGGDSFLPPNSISSVYHTITGTGFGLGPIQGTSSALLVARSFPFGGCDASFNGIFFNVWAIGCPLPPGVAGLPNAALGRPALAYPPDFALQGFATSGTSWIGQDIQGLAGDEIDLSLQYMTNEGCFLCGDDFEVIATRCPGTSNPCYSDPNSYVLSNLVGFHCPPTDANAASTGFALATMPCDVRLTLPADALWTVYIGVLATPDTQFASGILVDNVRQLREVVPVSSPGTLPLLLLGLAGLAASRQRKVGLVRRT